MRLRDTPEFKAWWNAFVEEVEAQEALDRAHIVPHDPTDEDSVIHAGRVAWEQRERALTRLFAAKGRAAVARAGYAAVRHPPPPGAGFYVTAIDGDRVAFLAGPFASNAEAAEWVAPARRLAVKLDPRVAPFAAFGTTAVSPPTQLGVLNERILPGDVAADAARRRFVTGTEARRPRAGKRRRGK